MLDISFCTPLGPGHDHLLGRCMSSVWQAMEKASLYWEHLIIRDDGRGRGGTRNKLMHQARGEAIMWLDADDEVHPDIINGMSDTIESDAVWGAIYTDKEGFRPSQEYPSCLADLLRIDPFKTLNIGYIIDREKQLEFPWNEDMHTGEDFDMYFRLWEKLDCVKIDQPIYINNRGEHSTGPRSATGGEWRVAVTNLQKEWRERLGVKK